MKSKVYILVILAAGMFASQAGILYANGPDTSECGMKAAYIYKCMQFIQLPEKNGTDDEGKDLKVIVVGITDKNLLNISRKVIGGKEIMQHKHKYKIMVEYVDVKQLLDKKTMSELDVLFFCHSGRRRRPPELLRSAINNSIVTFGETKGFVEAGGIVNFVVVKNRLRFEINTGAAEQADIRIRSQLSKLAIRVIDKKNNPKVAKD